MSKPRSNLTQPATEWNNTPPLHGTAHCWEAGSVESSLMVWSCMPNGPFPPAKTALMGGASGWLALPTQCAKEAMEGSGCCRRDDSSSQVPLPWPPDSGRQHDNWVWCMVGVMVWHHRHQPTSWPIKQAHTSRCHVRHWISADPIRFT